MDEALLQSIAKEIKEKLPKGFGFCLLAYELYYPDGEERDEHMYYVSDSDRKDVATAMVEWLKKVDNDEKFGKDI